MEQILADKKIKADKLIFKLSIIVFLYILFMILSYRLRFDNIVVIGVFRELFDLPAFALITIFFVLSVLSFIKEKFKFPSYPFYSIVILLVTIISLLHFL
jgi:hypothetical protein